MITERQGHFEFPGWSIVATLMFVNMLRDSTDNITDTLHHFTQWCLTWTMDGPHEPWHRQETCARRVECLHVHWFHERYASILYESQPCVPWLQAGRKRFKVAIFVPLGCASLRQQWRPAIPEHKLRDQTRSNIQLAKRSLQIQEASIMFCHVWNLGIIMLYPQFTTVEPARRPGDYLEFFAEIDLLGALSACPGGDTSAGHSDDTARCYPLRVEVLKPQAGTNLELS